MGSRYMITGKLCTDSKIKTVRDNLFQICPTTKYRLIDPHVTLIPPFEASSEVVAELHDIISEYVDMSLDIDIEGVGVYPNLSNPRVILLDVTAAEPVHDLRADLLSVLQSNTVELRYDPTPFHITLFKCDNGYTLAEDRKQLLQNRVHSNRDSWSNAISDVDLEKIT